MGGNDNEKKHLALLIMAAYVNNNGDFSFNNCAIRVEPNESAVDDLMYELSKRGTVDCFNIIVVRYLIYALTTICRCSYEISKGEKGEHIHEIFVDNKKSDQSSMDFRFTINKKNIVTCEVKIHTRDATYSATKNITGRTLHAEILRLIVDLPSVDAILKTDVDISVLPMYLTTIFGQIYYTLCTCIFSDKYYNQYSMFLVPMGDLFVNYNALTKTFSINSRSISLYFKPTKFRNVNSMFVVLTNKYEIGSNKRCWDSHAVPILESGSLFNALYLIYRVKKMTRKTTRNALNVK